jgi:tetratricopeptide (TPR) repeat protein
LYEEAVSIQKKDETVWIGLPAEQSAREQTVSIQQLEHRVPRAARKEHEKGMEALRKQQYPAAADHFKAALTFDPQYAAARNDLGVAYVRMRNWDAAAEQFRSVLDAVPGHQPANDNYIVALLQGERFAEAEEAADQILRRGGTPIAHYTAALCIVMRHGNFKEALDHLRLTEQTIPKGRLIAAQILEELGRRADAARALESYMQFAEAEPKLPALEKWLADLRQ